jgi:tetratricopeptide (TPR) repeat protein
VTEELGQGGMGRVLRGRDPDLGRELAIKVLLGEHTVDEGRTRRFIEEARIGGQLQHPGLVPVYEVGRVGEGVPYFTMKLVRGRTLAALLAERPDPSHELPHFVQVFEQVAQAIAYAHSKGVVHRDLKPANVMVGAFGEVQVMDWGLAKRMQQAEGKQPGCSLPTAPCLLPSGTQAGAILGTPAYMAPEQARGEVGTLDERADVFGLGAILCEVLTGGPPFGCGRVSPREQAKHGDLSDAFARLDGCGADAALIALAKGCLSARPEDRPRDAAEVARQVTAYREGVEKRLRAVEMERAAAEARAQEAVARARAERQARRLTLGLAACVLLTLAVGGGTAWYLRHRHLQQVADDAQRETEQARKEAERAQEVGGSLAVVDGYLAQAPERRRAEDRDRAWAALERAEGRLADSSDDALHCRVRQARLELEQVRRDQKMIAKLEEAWLQMAAPGKEEFDREGADRLFRQAFTDYGLDVDRLTPEEAGKRLAASPVAEDLIVALDSWARVLRDFRAVEKLRAIASQADRDGWRKRLRSLDAGKDRAAICQLAAAPLPERLAPSTIILLADQLRFAGEKAKALEVLRQAQRQHPGDFWLCFELAGHSFRRGSTGYEDAVRYLTAALALRPQSAVACYSLGLALAKQNKLDEAVAACRKAIELRPDYAEAYHNLGTALQQQKKLDEAVTAYRKAIELKPESALAFNNLGTTLLGLNKLDEAVAALRKAIALKPDEAVAYSNLGGALAAQKKLEEAVAAYRKAIDLEPEYAEAYNNLGTAFLQQEQLDEAVAAYRKAVALKPDYALAYKNLGTALGKQQKPDEAIAAYRKAVALKPDDANTYYKLGLALAKQKQLEEAATAFRKAVALKPDDADAYYNLGLALAKQKQMDEAVAAFRKAIALKPDYAETYNNLANALADLKELEEAVAAYRKAIELQPDYADAYFNLGLALARQKKWDEAVTAFRKAIALKPDDAVAYANLGIALATQQKLEEAVAAYRKAIALKSNYAEAYTNLGFALKAQKKLEEAVAAFQKADQLLPNQPVIRNNLRQTQHLLELDRKLAACLAGKDRPDSPRQAIDLGVFAAGYRERYHVAVRFYTDAFRDDPTLADNPQLLHRYNAACYAALAAAGQGQDAAALTAGERTALRRQALAWLRADLDARRRGVLDGNPRDRADADAALRHWQGDADLSSVRHSWSLLRLPAAERTQWRTLWGDVEALCRKSGG